MKNVTITINGKEYTAQMSDEAVAEITAEKKRTGYERVKFRERYWTDSQDGKILDYLEYYDNSGVDAGHYKAGNYYNDRQLAEDNARADRLMRRLRQWQALNDKPVDWSKTDDSSDNNKYFIFYDYKGSELDVGFIWSIRELSVVYFSTEEKAQEAIDVFHDELIWYFTQYRSRLDEPEVRDVEAD